MRKILKRIVAMSAAVMMMGTMVISASAYTNLEKSGAYCTANKSSGSVTASTSTKDGSNKTVGVNIVLYYKKTVTL